MLCGLKPARYPNNPSEIGMRGPDVPGPQYVVWLWSQESQIGAAADLVVHFGALGAVEGA